MIDLVKKMTQLLTAPVPIQQQLALALNSAGRGEDAERALTEFIP